MYTLIALIMSLLGGEGVNLEQLDLVEHLQSLDNADDKRQREKSLFIF